MGKMTFFTVEHFTSTRAHTLNSVSIHEGIGEKTWYTSMDDKPVRKYCNIDVSKKNHWVFSQKMPTKNFTKYIGDFKEYIKTNTNWLFSRKKKMSA